MHRQPLPSVEKIVLPVAILDDVLANGIMPTVRGSDSPVGQRKRPTASLQGGGGPLSTDGLVETTPQLTTGLVTVNLAVYRLKP